MKEDRAHFFALILLLVMLASVADGGITSLGHCKWCPEGGSRDIPYFFGKGLNSGSCTSGCVSTRLAIWSAVDEWEFFTQDPDGLDGAITFTFGGYVGDGDGPLGNFGIVFTYEDLGSVPCVGPASITADPALCHPVDQTIPLAISYPLNKIGQVGEMDECITMCVAINRNVDWTGFSRETAARHEVGHAIGLGHSTNSNDLMADGTYCGAPVKFVDDSAKRTTACIYGSPTIACIDEMFEVDPQQLDPGEVATQLNTCNCVHSCGTPVRLALGDKAGRSYEFAISEGGGSYAGFATVEEADLISQTYTHTFATSYSAAKIRVQAFEGGSLVGEGVSTLPIQIDAPTSVGGADFASHTPGVVVMPNPFSSETVMILDMPGPQTVTLAVYDLRGRLVRTLHQGTLLDGENRLAWDGRGEDHVPVAGGVYFARLMTPERSITRTLIRVK